MFLISDEACDIVSHIMLRCSIHSSDAVRQPSPMSTRLQRTAEQRRRRRDARRRILDAALELLEERQWLDVPLEEVMAVAGLSRTAFYRHFDDRDQLLLALLADAGERLQAAGQAWKHGAEEPVTALRDGLTELTAAMVDHGRLIQAIVDASAHDPDVRATFSQFLQQFIAVTAERIRAEVAAGRSPVRDPDDVAAALVRMSQAHLLAAFGHRPLADAARATETLTEIWSATIYRRHPQSS
jgi:TetR/AcrR family transcriptional regulator, ethionamide resistance regulator